ncbi:MAG: hypothetical protein LBI84_05310 [Propionibacteriaceae bacterium]|jgi:hypothetical protein|nr:hypothetical protein [Propionibacteriaceae bacterium]
MLLPTKGINCDRALLTVGGTIISLLSSPATVSALWERLRRRTQTADGQAKITFDWFALALTMLFAVQAVRWNSNGQLERCHVPA